MDGHATHKVVSKILFDASISDKRASSKAGGTKAQEYIALLPNDIQAWCVEFLSKVNVWTLQHANTFFSCARMLNKYTTNHQRCERQRGEEQTCERDRHAKDRDAKDRCAIT